MRRKMKAIVMAVLMLLVCGVSFANGSKEDAGTSSEGYNIGVAMADFKIPFFVRMMKGMEDAADRLGVNLDIQDGKSDPNMQISQIETFIIQKKDLVIIVAAQLDSLVPVADMCIAAGIPIVTVNRQLGEGADIVTYVGCDDRTGGSIQGEILDDLLGGKGNIILCQGSLGSSPQVMREQGLEDYIAENAPDINILAKQPEDWDKAKTIVVVENFLLKYKKGEIDAIVLQGPYEALGAVEAVKSSGRDELLGKIVCFDLPQEVVDSIHDGDIYGTVLQDPQEQGNLGIEVAVRYLNGDRNIEKQTWTDLPKVTVDNIGNYGAAW